MIDRKHIFLFLALATALQFVPELGFASVESSLMDIQSKLTHVILPTLSIIGIAWAAFSLLTGNERAKTHIWYAIIGSVVGFGAQAIEAVEGQAHPLPIRRVSAGSPAVTSQVFGSYIGRNGGADGTRTRGLSRDRRAL